MKLINLTTAIDDATYEPVHTVTLEIHQTVFDDLKHIEALAGRNDAAQIIGISFLEQMEAWQSGRLHRS